MKNINSVSYKRSLIIGTLLGDAYSRKHVLKSNGLRVEYMFRHGEGQSDFCRWKSSEINRLFNATTTTKNKEYKNFGYALFSLTKKKRETKSYTRLVSQRK